MDCYIVKPTSQHVLPNCDTSLNKACQRYLPFAGNRITKDHGAESALLKDLLWGKKVDFTHEANLNVPQALEPPRLEDSFVEANDFSWDRDIAVVTENVRKMWFFDSDSRRIGNLGALTFVLHYLLVSSSAKVLVDKATGEFLGMFCLNDKIHPTFGESTSFLTKKVKLYEKLVQASLYVNPKAKSFRVFNELFFLNYDKMRRMLTPQFKEKPELVLLFTSPYTKYRGVGRAMISSVRNELLKQDVHEYYLLTDNSCDFGFYDHLKMERVLDVNLSFNINHIPDYDHYLNCFLKGYVYVDRF